MDYNTTPRARPALKFANRVYNSTPNSSSKRIAGLQSSARKAARFDESTLSRGDGNIFRASTLSAAATPSSSRFEPSIPRSTMKKSFSTPAVGATPNTQRVYRETVAKFTPRGMASHSASKELFEMRIPSPPLELSGAELTKRVPRDMERKGTVYADQYLSHVVPREFDELQRRQFFCILDLRRLKYAANEVFTKKDWKLNIINFAKEFEKSRSLILLRYGLYEFQNVKPSDDVLRRWKVSHGLPVDDEDDKVSTKTVKSGTAGSKRKAEDDLTPEKTTTTTAANDGKRRLFEEDDVTSKRKSDAFEEQPRKALKPSTSSTSSSTPSATRALFEKIASKTASEPTEKETSTTSNVFGSSITKPAANPFQASVADYEGSDSETRATTSKGKTQNTSKTASNSVSQNLKKGYDRTEPATASASAPTAKPTVNKTWTPDTPIKFAPGTAASGSGLFGSSTPAAEPSTSSLLGQKAAPGATTTPTSLFGAKKPEETKNDVEENPKSTEASTSLFGTAKPAETTPKSLFGSTPTPAVPATSIFGSKKDETTATPSTSLFGAGTSTPDASTPKPAASSLFGKPAESTTTTGATSSGSSLFGSTAPKPSLTGSATTPNLFGAAPVSSTESSSILSKSETPSFPTSTSTPSLFGAANSAVTPATGPSILGIKPDDKPVEAPKSLFGASAALSTPTSGSSLFGAAAPASSSGNLFGNSKPSLAPPATFDFSSTAKAPATESKPMFASNPIDGSPMKQDSPAKRSIGDDSMQQDSPPVSKKLFGNNGGSAASTFSFGGTPAVTAAPAPSFSFGAPQPSTTAASQTSTGGSGLFGANTSFTFGGASNGSGSTSSSFSNPFSQGPATGGTAAAAPSFSFSGASSTTTPSASFQFGGTSSQEKSDSNGGNMFSFTASNAKPNNARSTTPLPPGKRPTLVPKSLRGRSNSPAISQGNGSSLPNPFANAPGANAAPSFSFGSNDTNGNQAAPQFQFGNSTPATTDSTEKSSNGTSGTQSAKAPKESTAAAEVTATTTSTTMTTPSTAIDNKPLQNKSLFGSVLSGASTPATATTSSSTPATATPSVGTPAAGNDDDTEAPQEQINLTDGGPGEEEEDVVYEVRAKMLLFVKDDAKNPWSTQGVGPLRLLKHKTKKTVRMLLRREPSGHVAFNRAVLASSKYEATGKTVKLITTSATGSGFETWIATVKTPEAAKALAEALEKYKSPEKDN
ncbi:hypothetical protein BROUX41_000838 [Berkeleyomyces rouxiae]